MGYIYKITNIQTNKIYVGKTLNDVNERFKEHISKGRTIEGSSKISKSLREYGSLNHTIEILEICLNAEMLKREQYWIDKLNTLYIGYNIKNEYKEKQNNEYWGNKETALKNIREGKIWNSGISPKKETREKISLTKKKKSKLGLYKSYGHKQSEETKNKLSQIAKERPKISQETIEKLRVASSNKICYYSIVDKKRIFLKKEDIIPNNYTKGKGTCWVYKDNISVSIDIWNKQKYINDGYKEGRIICGKK